MHKTKNSTSQKNLESLETELYDKNHNVSNKIRLEIISHRPPKNSLSELIYLDKSLELEKKLK